MTEAMEATSLERVVRAGLTGKATFEQKPECKRDKSCRCLGKELPDISNS